MKISSRNFINRINDFFYNKEFDNAQTHNGYILGLECAKSYLLQHSGTIDALDFYNYLQSKIDLIPSVDSSIDDFRIGTIVGLETMQNEIKRVTAHGLLI